MSNSTKNLK